MSDRNLAAAEKNVLQTAADYGRQMARSHAEQEPQHYFTGLVGQQVFVGGHRYHWVGDLDRVDIMATGEAVAVLNNCYQIDYDENDRVQSVYKLGNEWRVPESCVGLAIQPTSGRSQQWRDSYRDLTTNRS